MKEKIEQLMKKLEPELIKFTQELVRIKSYTGNEKEIAMFIKKKMKELDYDNIKVDNLGNVIGIVGTGEKSILFDSHIDTVEVLDEVEWSCRPFGGEIKDGYLYGRGSSDMKGGVAASVYAGYIAKELGLLDGKKVYISTSIMEEDFDGVALEYILREQSIKPDYAVICEPSELKIATGHRGRALIKITTEGVSSHGSFPEKGVNAIYKMNPVIKRVSDLQETFQKIKSKEKGSVALSKIESNSVSLNAVPDLCTIYLDRRLAIYETYEVLKNELENLVDGLDAKWEILDQKGKSWKGQEVVLHSFLPAWEIEKEHQFVKVASESYKTLYSKEPELFKWDFSTNGVIPAGKYKIPTIGIGPGNPKEAHTRDEKCLVKEITDVCMFYAMLIDNLK